jgi:hypothetical protein
MIVNRKTKSHTKIVHTSIVMKPENCIALQDHLSLSDDIKILIFQLSYYLGRVTKSTAAIQTNLSLSEKFEEKTIRKNETMIMMIENKLNDYNRQFEKNNIVKTAVHKRWTINAWGIMCIQKSLIEHLSDSNNEKRTNKLKGQVMTNLYRISRIVSDIDEHLLEIELSKYSGKHQKL